MTDSMGTGEGGPASASGPGATGLFCVTFGPLASGVRLEVEGPELVVADDDLGITLVGLGFPVGDVVELENPVLLHLEVGVVGLLPGLYGLKGDTLLAEKRPESLMADVVDHPLSHQVLGQLRERPGGKGLVVVGRSAQSDLLDGPALRHGELGWSTAGVSGGQGFEPIGVEVVQDLSHPVL
jgi:hypothetical protein